MTITVSNEGTAKRQVLDYLTRGHTLSAASAKSRFGVANFRALISDIKSQVEAYGNWEVIPTPQKNGTTAYSMEFLGDPSVNPFWNRVNA